MFHEGVAPALLLCVFHFPLNKLRRLFIHSKSWSSEHGLGGGEPRLAALGAGRGSGGGWWLVVVVVVVGLHRDGGARRGFR
jgi:hypothetical protein